MDMLLWRTCSYCYLAGAHKSVVFAYKYGHWPGIHTGNPNIIFNIALDLLGRAAILQVNFMCRYTLLRASSPGKW